MEWAALLAWVVTALGGASLMVQWLAMVDFASARASAP